ncbi:MAG: helix-turn-helix transcriptional regulator [Verrucomicrobia bacterium]|nr:helix-turn-helix transcriptional regulator [Verrucomicrobiota bacterium]
MSTEKPNRGSQVDETWDFLRYHRELSSQDVMVPEAISQTLGWAGLQAARYRNISTKELQVPRLSQHVLILVTKPPNEMSVRCDEFKRDIPPPTGSITFFPARSMRDWRWRGTVDSLQIALEPRLLATVAAQSFDLELSATSIPPLNSFMLRELRSTILAVESELISGEIGGSIIVESLANILAVQLLRHVFGRRRPSSRTVAPLPRHQLDIIVDYMMANLSNNPTLNQMATLVRRSPYHFARQFKAATGLAPHQFLIARRVERAQELLRRTGDVNLGDVAIAAGFYDQSLLSLHFKRIVGVTPGQFRASVNSA